MNCYTSGCRARVELDEHWTCALTDCPARRRRAPFHLRHRLAILGAVLVPIALGPLFSVVLYGRVLLPW